MNIELIADLLGTGGMLCFVLAEVFQLKKIYKTKKLTGLSKTCYRNKMLAIALTSSCFALSGLYLSFSALVVEGLIVGKIMLLMRKRRRWRKN